ncbi:MAG: hypothetical protein A3C43_06245 [Candidatus Schekmanbacteria bacterium RIFCSPHIGHO2_02_FULL_38_11]|uniref:Transposase IS200-like domain-containing protein n=1 Tax=Candidatus Schekmanbacteria bacterium RIFCSPLOWO2_12_FULL_38_15 TaxID=1817883 RepID=A0A1F7SH15_9BACT|nr:MAG: hypothetical protein A2043_02500 [Candidatus Schekmanbacteria bacterium GWA2_38_9]OGL50603.1 MAG: hypothetical protein A3H37_02020 [Candidatus Schekmanbacteria bacterium RIFCSPLOWO2_02_FULL_38_14]OGL52467.1 MAG: hypothetical protein A3G31_10780 [Candidatus Schekmanbacteria bacterium RIFCSPLOWO2_12_FULL_38_15]OGL55649.1 MAG: hypothetical protein A3C43_06245 [Candidatus Schekmanbacteria bacterium RIFCSPHIGHO2_02_FULL_38_11]
MKNSCNFHYRKSIRLKGYDYSNSGIYFITICTKDRELYFKKFSELKEILKQQWQKIPEKFFNIQLDEFIIMPNHIHGIITVGATLAVAQKKRAGARPAPTIGEIIGRFKSSCVNDWIKYIDENKLNLNGKFWQRNYYEHIIRNENELNKIREYIQNNPLKWHLDRENQEKTGNNPLEDAIFKCS